MFTGFQREIKGIIKSLVELAWYMRGGVQYKDLLLTTSYERQIMQEFISHRMESQGKLLHPVY
jgi:hypothetical protein